MTLGSVGWLCPKCGRISSPYQAVCSICVPTIGAGTYTGWSGTITPGGTSYSGLSHGTFYAAPPKTDAQKLEEARQESNRWREKYESLVEQLQELIETDDDDDD